MLELLGTVFGSIFSGGATGLIGIVLQRVADYKNKQLDLQIEQQKQSHEIALRRVDAEIMAQEWAARTKVAEVEAAGREAVADAQAFAASFGLEPKRYAEGVKFTHGQGWVMVALDALRGSVRPMLTVYLCLLTTLVYLQARTVLGSAELDVATATDVWKMVVGNILYLTTTCVLWWFGTRSRGKPPELSK